MDRKPVFIIFVILCLLISVSCIRGNDFKIEARNNKLNINPGEELLLTVFAPKEMYEGNHNIDLEDPHIEIKGFLNEVTEINQFNMIGGHRTMDS
ncbi:hypothetical protein ABER23_04880 [Paenibacillus lautus]|uniref:hypothetical protein n=1 Tax=Paenibacillus lautus TaxID=1401 RepID=UPI003D28C2D7